MQRIIKKLYDNNIEFLQNVSLKTKTWIHRGPMVPLFIIPDTIYKFELCVLELHSSNLKFKVVGHTSNLYFQETYKIDVIISTNKLNKIEFNNDYIECMTGVNVSILARACVNKGFKGFEGLVGLPGTVGAAFINNSSCYNCSISNLVISAEALVIQENVGGIIRREITAEEMDFSRRNSKIKRGELKAIVLTVRLKKQKAENHDAVILQAERNIEHRKKTQEGKAKNLGSIYSERKERYIGLFSLGIMKAPMVFGLRIMDYFYRGNFNYTLKRNRFLLLLYGYKDIRPYVSEKNLNCFIWKDDNADKAFVRYEEFMHKCFNCGKLEIEILK